MKMNTDTIMGILIPFAGTSLGAAMVFILKKNISDRLQKILTGFAAGVMVAASFWSLLEPALESSEGMGALSFVPAAVGFLVGTGFLLLLDTVIIAAYAMVLGRYESAMYSLIAMYVTTKVVDLVLYGIDNACLCYIISDSTAEITREIVSRSRRSVLVIPFSPPYTPGPARTRWKIPPSPQSGGASVRCGR